MKVSGVLKKAFAKNEVYAYRVDQLFGFDFVPATVFRNYKEEVHSLQYFMNNTTMGADYISKYRQYPDPAQMGKLHFFDYLTGVYDRRGPNYLFDNTTHKLIAIDHGLVNHFSVMTMDRFSGYTSNFLKFHKEPIIAFLKSAEGKKIKLSLKNVETRKIIDELEPFMKEDEMRNFLNRKKFLENLTESFVEVGFKNRPRGF